MFFDLFPLLLLFLATSLLIPRLCLWLYIWFFLVLYAIFSFPNSYRYTDKSGPDAFGEAILYLVVLVIIISIAIRLLIILLFSLSNRDRSNRSPTELSLSIGKITFIAYGILSGYYIFLFLTYFLEGYQPAWEAYSILIIVILLFLILFRESKKYLKYHRFQYLRSLNLFFLSLSLIIGFLAISSFIFASIAFIQTNKLITKYSDRNVRVCIQPKIDTWLDLTPLTTWNKRGRVWGATTNHAVLVIQISNETKLYNWSYKLRKWDYLTTGFLPSSFKSPSSL